MIEIDSCCRMQNTWLPFRICIAFVSAEIREPSKEGVAAIRNLAAEGERGGAWRAESQRLFEQKRRKDTKESRDYSKGL